MSFTLKPGAADLLERATAALSALGLTPGSLAGLVLADSLYEASRENPELVPTWDAAWEMGSEWDMYRDAAEQAVNFVVITDEDAPAQDAD